MGLRALLDGRDHDTIGATPRQLLRTTAGAARGPSARNSAALHVDPTARFGYPHLPFRTLYSTVEQGCVLSVPGQVPHTWMPAAAPEPAAIWPEAVIWGILFRLPCARFAFTRATTSAHTASGPTSLKRATISALKLDRDSAAGDTSVDLHDR